MVSALDPAQYVLGPASVVAVVSLDFGQSLHSQAGAALAFDWQGGRHVQTGLGTGVIDFLLSPVYQEQGPMEIVARSAETWPHIETARAGILDGSVLVLFNPDDMTACPATEASASLSRAAGRFTRTVTISVGGSLHGTGAGFQTSAAASPHTLRDVRGRDDKSGFRQWVMRTNTYAVTREPYPIVA